MAYEQRMKVNIHAGEASLEVEGPTKDVQDALHVFLNAFGKCIPVEEKPVTLGVNT